MAETPDRESSAIHAIKNQLAIIIGFSELLLVALRESDPNRDDVLEIHNAAHAALTVVNEQLKAGPS